jgi:hypothetical protein
MSLQSRCLTICLAVALIAPQQMARAQSPEACLIVPSPPAFEAEGATDRLHAVPHPRTAAHTAFHGQGLYGNETLYLSHLAVFMGLPESHPHNFQVILEVAFADPEAKARYQADRAQHANLLYTAVPPMFDQLALVTEHPGRKPLRELPATTVFRGHFEQGGVPILEGVMFDVQRIVHFREFLSGGSKLDTQHYLLFGRDGDVFLSHLLAAPPDFDQILSVEFEAKDVPNESLGQLIETLLAQGLYLHLSDRENTVATRVHAGESFTCSLETGTRAMPITVELRVAEEHHCEAGEFTKLVMDRFNPPEHCED